MELIIIMLHVGALDILQSINGQNFIAKAVIKANMLLLEYKTVVRSILNFRREPKDCTETLKIYYAGYCQDDSEKLHSRNHKFWL